MIPEQLDAGDIRTVRVHDAGRVRRVARIHAVERDVTCPGACDGCTQHINSVNRDMRSVRQVNCCLACLDLNSLSCRISIEIQLVLRRIVVPFILTVKRTIDVGEIVRISFDRCVLHIRQPQRRKCDRITGVIEHICSLAGPSAARIYPECCALKEAVAELFECRVLDRGI